MTALLDPRYTVLNGSEQNGFLGDAFPHVGNMLGARNALAHHRTGEFEQWPHGPYLGQGISRTAYTDGKVVYKVPRSNNSNVTEYVNMRALRLARYPYIGPCDLYYVDGVAIIAQPFYPYDMYHCAVTMRGYNTVLASTDFLRRVTHSVMAGDLHGGNIRFTETFRPRVIDIGEIR